MYLVDYVTIRLQDLRHSVGEILMSQALNDWLADDLMQHNPEVLIIMVDDQNQMKAYEKFQEGGVLNTFLISFLTEIIKTTGHNVVCSDIHRSTTTNGTKGTNGAKGTNGRVDCPVVYLAPPDWGWCIDCKKDEYTRHLIVSGNHPKSIDVFANIPKQAIHVHPGCYHSEYDTKYDEDGFEISFR